MQNLYGRLNSNRSVYAKLLSKSVPLLEHSPYCLAFQIYESMKESGELDLAGGNAG